MTQPAHVKILSVWGYGLVKAEGENATKSGKPAFAKGRKLNYGAAHKNPLDVFVQCTHIVGHGNGV